MPRDSVNYKVYTRMDQQQQDRLNWLVYRTGRSRQELTLEAILALVERLEREVGTDPRERDKAAGASAVVL